MDNMRIYEAVRSVPENAQKSIGAGRLKGKTDINPMWRLKALTEQFGPCGIGWKYVITQQWLEAGPTGEVAAFCNIDLYIKDGETWSDPIPGTGGSSFVANERNGAYVSDECYKMALTDAISVACKALGFGADIYWAGDKTKYDRPSEEPAPQGGQQTVKPPVIVCTDCGRPIQAIKSGGVIYKPQDIAAKAKGAYGRELCWECCKLAADAKQKAPHSMEALDEAIQKYGLDN